MTKRREVYFEYESVTDKPTKGNWIEPTHFSHLPDFGCTWRYFIFLAEIEVLCSRAARLSYLSPFEFTQAWDPRINFFMADRLIRPSSGLSVRGSLTQAINEHTNVTINRLSKLTSSVKISHSNWKGFTSRTTRGGTISSRNVASRSVFILAFSLARSSHCPPLLG